MDDLFSQIKKTAKEERRPLADRIRPKDLVHFVGQKKLLGENSLLQRLIQEDKICSMIFWGPPGSGKTTLAMIIANLTNAEFIRLSAVTAGIKDIKSVIETAKLNQRQNRKTILFIDEIHRFNKIQQDAFLPYVENGTLILIGATTENPSFSIISPLSSRCRIFTLNALEKEDIMTILARALEDKKQGMGNLKIKLEEGVQEMIVQFSDGDARRALNLLEIVVQSSSPDEKGEINITQKKIGEILQRDHLLYDKTGEEHYNLISAFHKSLRGSDPQASIYWLGRMVSSGEDPLFIARRMIRFAAEDIGLADPQALIITNFAWESYNHLGSPEGEIALFEAAIYLATAPKSNSIYVAENNIKSEIESSGSLPVPLTIRNAPTPLMKSLDYGKDYLYDHNFKDRYAPQDYLPEELKNKIFYEPGQFGFEREVKKRLDWWEKKKEEFFKNKK